MTGNHDVRTKLGFSAERWQLEYRLNGGIPELKALGVVVIAGLVTPIQLNVTAIVYPPLALSRLSIFAQVSRNGTVRLNTSRSLVVSGSTQK